jgi:uncharacterized protein with HEPN domain
VTDEDISQKLFSLGNKGLATCRNISAHDYDSLNWDKVKAVCKRLLDEKANAVINECLEIAEREERSVKDYAASTKSPSRG